MFHLDNTSGFTQSDIDLLNAAVNVLKKRGIDEKNATDIVNNNWQESGNNVRSLTRVNHPNRGAKEFTDNLGNIFRVVPHPSINKSWSVAVWSSSFSAWTNEAMGTFTKRSEAIADAQSRAQES